MALLWKLHLITGFFFYFEWGQNINQTMRKSQSFSGPFPRISPSYAQKSRGCRSSTISWQSAFAVIWETRTWLIIHIPNSGVLNPARCWVQETHLRNRSYKKDEMQSAKSDNLRISDLSCWCCLTINGQWREKEKRVLEARPGFHHHRHSSAQQGDWCMLKHYGIFITEINFFSPQENTRINLFSHQSYKIQVFILPFPAA